MRPTRAAALALLVAAFAALAAEARPRRRALKRSARRGAPHAAATRATTSRAGTNGASTNGDEESDPAEARRHAESARILFELQEYDGAVDEWKEAYRLKPAPLLLFNIAQASRMSGRLTEARRAYVRYLEAVDAGSVPKNGPARSEVELRISELDARRTSDGASPPRPTATAPASPAATGPDRPDSQAELLGVSADLLVPDVRSPVASSSRGSSRLREDPPVPVYTPPARPARIAAASLGVVAAGLGIAAAFQQFEAGTIWSDAQNAGKSGDELLFARTQAADAQGRALWMLTGALSSAAMAGGVWWWSREAAR